MVYFFHSIIPCTLYLSYIFILDYYMIGSMSNTLLSIPEGSQGPKAFETVLVFFFFLILTSAFSKDFEEDGNWFRSLVPSCNTKSRL